MSLTLQTNFTGLKSTSTKVLNNNNHISHAHLRANTPATTTAKLIPHHTHYYEDGTFCFVVESTIFRVYKGLLARRSQIFKDLFSIPQSRSPPSAYPSSFPPSAYSTSLAPSASSSRAPSPSQSFLSSTTSLPPSYQSSTTSTRATTPDQDPLHAHQQGQMMIDGVPAVRLDDSAEDFANLLDIIMPGLISSSGVTYTFDELAGVVRICDKYLIDDVRDWAISWIDDILPSTIDDLPKLECYWGNAGLIVRVFMFARQTNMAKYLPLAFYTLAFHQWSPEDRDSLMFMLDNLSVADQTLILTGRTILQQFIVEQAVRLPDLGLAARSICTETFVNTKERTCGMHKQDGWTEPMDLVGALLRGPLEVLDYRVRHPPRGLCGKCTLEYVRSSSLLRMEVWKMLAEVFKLDLPISIKSKSSTKSSL